MIHKIKALHDNGEGLSVRAIASELGLARNTVRKYLWVFRSKPATNSGGSRPLIPFHSGHRFR